MSLWLNEAGALIWNGTAALDCAICPCPGQHISPCNGVVGVPAKLIMTLSYNAGSTIEVPLRWTESSSTCSASEGWAYRSDSDPLNDVVMCAGINFRDTALCCGRDVAGLWAMEFVWTDSGIQQSLSTISGIDPIVIVSDGSVTPLHYTTAIPGGLGGCVVTDVLVDIQAAP